MINRRDFLGVLASGAAAASLHRAGWAGQSTVSNPELGVSVAEPKLGEDIFAYIRRVKGGFDSTLYMQILGAANAFKEGDEIVGVAAAAPPAGASTATADHGDDQSSPQKNSVGGHRTPPGTERA